MADIRESERTLPFNLEAERAVLGVVLVHNEAWPTIAAVLTEADFYREAHRRLWAAMSRLAMDGSPVDFALLREELSRTGDLDEVGGPAYVTSLADGVPRATNVEYYARVVREKARLRGAIYAANKVVASAYEAEQPAATVVESGVRDLLALADAHAGGITQIGSAVRDYVNSLDDEREVSIPCGLRDVDDITGGFALRRLTIVAARPGVGKSSFALCAADHAAGTGTPAAIISLEMEDRAQAANLLAVHSGVPSDRLRRKMVGDKQWSRIGHAVSLLDGRPLYLVSAAETLTQVAAWVRRLREVHAVRVVFLDYLQLIGDSRSKDRQQEVAALSRGLARLAMREEVAMVALSQLSREPERRTDKRPHLSDLRESGSLEQDAHLVLLLFRADMYDHDPNSPEAGTAEVIVAKNRAGPTGVARVCFLSETTRFCDLAMV